MTSCIHVYRRRLNIFKYTTSNALIQLSLRRINHLLVVETRKKRVQKREKNDRSEVEKY